jgi:hypothetical protein
VLPQVMGDAHFDAAFGLRWTAFGRVNLGLGLLCAVCVGFSRAHLYAAPRPYFTYFT